MARYSQFLLEERLSFTIINVVFNFGGFCLFVWVGGFLVFFFIFPPSFSPLYSDT